MSAAQENRIKLSISNWVHVIVCLALLWLCLAWLLRPALDRNVSARARLEQLQDRLAAHEALVGLRDELAAALSAGPGDPVETIAAVIPLLRDDFADFQSRLRGLAEACQLQVEQIAPRVVSKGASGRYLGVDMVATGRFGEMRAFVEALLKLPNVFHFESLSIAQDHPGERLEATVWFKAE
jgi:hypothetical protein